MSNIKVNNSITNDKESFKVNGNRIKWYICGPTVYDASHLGHARTYVSFDIIRRILANFFNYEITYVMNITDIDDKIIQRANDGGIEFSKLARQWETEFLDDMRNLNVLPPTVMTRVSEYVPEIIAYIEKIIDNGYAYISNGSIYFDTSKYETEKLRPTVVDTCDEGYNNEKRNARDFVLWKRSKPGEPSWDSKWGPGRPGWHIECSTMASDILGDEIDIHAGGEDLKFPHHHNEIVQSEAYFKKNNWIRYFLHSGHLHIEGLKMSKSLKNFITIKDVLKEYSSNQLRMLFLLHRYDTPMNYSKESLEYAVNVEKRFNDFLENVRAMLRKETSHYWRQEEKELYGYLLDIKSKVRERLEDNFDTPEVINLLLEVINKTYVYIKNFKDVKEIGVGFIINEVLTYVESLLTVLGFTKRTVSNNIDPLLDIITLFRSEVRVGSKDKDYQRLFSASDNLRDIYLPLVGVTIQDQTDDSSWKYLSSGYNVDEYKKRINILPRDLFKLAFKDQYSKYDENGIPTHDKKGNQIKKSQLDKLKHIYLQHELLYNYHRSNIV